MFFGPNGFMQCFEETLSLRKTPRLQKTPCFENSVDLNVEQETSIHDLSRNPYCPQRRGARLLASDSKQAKNLKRKAS